MLGLSIQPTSAILWSPAFALPFVFLSPGVQLWFDDTTPLYWE